MIINVKKKIKNILIMIINVNLSFILYCMFKTKLTEAVPKLTEFWTSSTYRRVL